MNIQAEVSLYPLRTDELSPPVEAFCQTLIRRGLTVEPGPMSTRIWGDHERAFAALREAFGQLIDQHEIVLIVKISNCCPQNGEEKADE